MTNTEKFFVECVKKGIKGEQVEALPEALDYTQFYRLCKSQSMTVAVFKALESVKGELLPEFWATMKRSARRRIMRDVQSQYDVEAVLTALEERGLKYMALKGYHLKKLYPSTDMRYTSDCDILIDVAQLKEVRALVDELGLKTARRDEHHDIVYYPITRTVLELHKCIFVGPLGKYFGIGFEKAHLKTGTKACYEMTPEDFYISILGHSAYHFAESAGVGIRHLTDVYLYRKAYALDYAYLDAELAKCGLLQFKNAFEKLADYFFDDGDGDEFTKLLAKHVLESSVLANEDKKAAAEVAANADGGEKKARKKSVWRKIFLPTEQMKFSYPILKKAIWLLPLFHVVRWVQVLFTRPKAIKQLKGYNTVATDDLARMKELRNGLGINNL